MISLSCLALLLVLFLANQCAVSVLVQEKEIDLIEKSCELIDGYEECVTVLGSDPRAKKSTDVKELAYIILDLCIVNATDTLGEIPKLQENYSKNGQIGEALSSCAMEYQRAINDYFGEAIKQLGTSSYQEAQYSAHIGGALGTSCEQEFYFQAPAASPLWSRNHDLAVLGHVAEGIVSLLRSNEI